MNLTVVLSGMICKQPTNNPHAVAMDEIRVRASTGTEGTLNYKILGEYGFGKFVKEQVKLINQALYSGDLSAEPAPFIRLYFYERVLDVFEYDVGLVFVSVKSGQLHWEVGDYTEDEGTVFPGDYPFKDFDGARRFLMKGTGGLYYAFITAQLSL